jgi:hypothetical protein
MNAQNTNVFPLPSGSVGIGTTSPQANLHIKGTPDLSAFIESTTDGTAALSLKSNNKMFMWSKRTSGESDALSLFYHNGTTWIWPEYINVQTNGNIGFGTATPREKLEVEGNVQVTGDDAYVQIHDRLTLQLTNSADNGWTRAFIGQNIRWNTTTSKWRVDNTPYNDFSMLRFENNGDMGFYTGPVTTSGANYEMDDAGLHNSKRMNIDPAGNVGIGTDDTKGYRFAVNGSAIFTSVKVKQYSNWPDYVFQKSYTLQPLSEIEKFVQKYQHLPDVPSAAEVAKDGIDLGDNQAVLLKKIEELTLYIIEQEKRIRLLEEKVNKSK